MSHFATFLLYLLWPAFIFVAYQAVKVALKKLKLL
jgi:hypothetical protein